MNNGSSESHLCELWHRRMAHLHHQALQVLREIVTSLPQFSIERQEVCKGCALGKYTKSSFRSNEHREVNIL